jgi:hypothetical protein
VAKFIGNYVRGVPVGVYVDPATAGVKLGAQLPLGFDVTILHQHESLNLASLVDPRMGPPTLSKHSFEGCQLVGPSILVPIGSVEIAGCDFDLQGASLNSLVWALPAGMPVTGAVVVTDLSLFRCSLVQVAFAVPPDQREGVLAMLREH